jgi:hypothetical protein
LLARFGEFGAQWKLMTQFFPGRTDLNIKNHYMTMRRQESARSRRSEAHRHSHSRPAQGPVASGEPRPQPVLLPVSLADNSLLVCSTAEAVPETNPESEAKGDWFRESGPNDWFGGFCVAFDIS